MKRLLFWFIALASAHVLGGCGQSGPLYLPGNPSEIQTPAAQPDDDDGQKKAESPETP